MSELALSLSLYTDSGLDHSLKMAQTMFKGGLLPSHIRSPEAALFLMQIGISLGVNPAIFVLNSALINGKVFMGIHICQGLLADKGVRWQISNHTSKTCTVTFTREGWPEHKEVYDEEDFNAQKLSSKDPWKTNPKQITYAQAFRRGARIIASDILLGMAPIDESEIDDWKREPATVIEHQTDFAKTADAGAKARAVGPRAKPLPELSSQPKAEPIVVPAQPELVQESIPAGGGFPPGIMEAGQVLPEPAPKGASKAAGSPKAAAVTGPFTNAIIGKQSDSPVVAPTDLPPTSHPVTTQVFDPANTEHRKAITRMMDDRVIPGRWRNANRDALLTHLEGRGLKDWAGILDEYIQGNPVAPVAPVSDMGGM